ncbi:HAD family hydrolase [Legionella feeleii]|uniref:Phosphatase yihX n=1 Tax=Legionella feeleii TaxID=453 RepID=A0A378IXM0_9GAMM|nr:HAD family phosphatase [Legionella feeleii]STX39650.1 Phosphatase yihX [Legionella feeleii]
MNIKNIIFDVGNVIVTWSPAEIIRNTFPNYEPHQQQYLVEKIFRSSIWINLNLGKISEEEAKLHYLSELKDIDAQHLTALFNYVKSTQVLIPGTTDLIKSLHKNGYNLFALTDNIKEIILYLKNKYDFWDYFTHSTVSADIGFMKPSQEIFNYALQRNNLIARETLFIDDHEPNTQAASLLGLHTILFSDSISCVQRLKNLGVAIEDWKDV